MDRREFFNRLIAEASKIGELERERLFVRVMLNGIANEPNTIDISQTRGRLLAMHSRLSQDLRYSKDKLRRLDLVIGVMRSGGNSNNGPGPSNENSGNSNNGPVSSERNGSNPINRILIPFFFLLFAVLVTIVFIFLVLPLIANIPVLLPSLPTISNITELLPSLSEVSYNL
jgi:hypothetical protein